MNRFSYPVMLSPSEEGGYVVSFPDFPEAITQGETLEESLAEAADCIEEAIAARIDGGLDIPESKANPGEKYWVAVPLQMALKAALYLAMQDSGMANTQLAKLLGKDEKEVRRILDPRHGTKLPIIEQALRRLGKQPELHLR